ARGKDSGPAIRLTAPGAAFTIRRVRRAGRPGADAGAIEYPHPGPRLHPGGVVGRGGGAAVGANDVCEERCEMRQKVVRSALFAGLGMLAVLLSYGAASSADDKKDKDDLPDIPTIMKRAHTKTDGYLAR